jgi:hypothetical protein
MPLTPAQLTALKNEITDDTVGYGYAPHMVAGSDNALTDLLNRPRDGTDGTPPISIRRRNVSSQEIWEAIDVSDFPALTGTPTAAQLSSERRNLAWLTGLASIPTIRLLNDDGSNTPIIANLDRLFPAGTNSRTRLVALGSRFGSRAEQLFGRDVMVTAEDVARARRLVEE